MFRNCFEVGSHLVNEEGKVHLDGVAEGVLGAGFHDVFGVEVADETIETGYEGGGVEGFVEGVFGSGSAHALGGWTT